LRQHAQGLDGNVKHTKRSLVVALTVLALFVCAGTHENEIAGILAAYWLIEKSRVHGAKLFVMPRANAAGAAWSSQNSQSPRILQAIPGVSRTFRYGARLSNLACETVSDPPLFLPPAAPAGFPALAGQEMRNLNREYPGSTDSSMTARLAFAIISLLKAENISIAINLHEASAGSNLAYSIVTRAEFLDEAVLAVLDLEETTGKSFRLEESKPEFAGYSHWEWGKLGIHAFLVETFNPAQPSDDPAVDQFNNAKSPLAERVYAHLWAVQALMANAGVSLGISVNC
jgi:succinylglutamate desuccinylase